jgi:hypothetical protein
VVGYGNSPSNPNFNWKMDIVAHRNPNTGEGETEPLQVPDQFGLHDKALSQKENKTQ